MKIAVMIGLMLALSVGVAGAQQIEEATSPAIEIGSKVKLEYTLADDGGTVLVPMRERSP